MKCEQGASCALSSHRVLPRASVRSMRDAGTVPVAGEHMTADRSVTRNMHCVDLARKRLQSSAPKKHARQLRAHPVCIDLINARSCTCGKQSVERALEMVAAEPSD
jgi:hypothetical protein